MMIYWECTTSCALACRHCRASAMRDPHPLELRTNEARSLLEDIASFGEPGPHLVMTGGDPLARADLMELIRYAVSLGIRVSVTPAATEALTEGALQALKDAGVESIALSLDGSTAQRHDDIRQVSGCFARTEQAAKIAGRIGLPLQINTLVSEETLDDLPAIHQFIHSFPLVRWSLFFLISVGRGKQLNEVDPVAGEALMKWVQGLAAVSPFIVATTEAPSYRRVAQELMVADGLTPEQIRNAPVRRGHGIRDGNGVVFISHLGQVFPSGFLPLPAGNVRTGDLVAIYRDSELFRAVRDVDNFKGKCGRCEYRKICGGSRARAFAHTGDPTESDPLCLYEPPPEASRPQAGLMASVGSGR